MQFAARSAHQLIGPADLVWAWPARGRSTGGACASLGQWVVAGRWPLTSGLGFCGFFLRQAE